MSGETIALSVSKTAAKRVAPYIVVAIARSRGKVSQRYTIFFERDQNLVLVFQRDGFDSLENRFKVFFGCRDFLADIHL